MKILRTASLFIAFSFFLLACSESADRSEVSDNVDILTDSLRDDAATNRDEEFVEDLLEDNSETVAWLRAGSTMGTDARLRRDAASMLDDHVALNTRLRSIATSKAYVMDDLDAEDSTADATDDKRGAGWDDDWADEIVDQHKKMMKRMDDYADDTKDPDILAFINETRPKLARHLQMSEALANRLKD